MTWLTKLSETYDNHSKSVGIFEKNHFDREYTLLPVSHTTQTAHIEIYLNLDGSFSRARPLEKGEGSTIIPCTEASASRTSAPVPYPLHDKLMYVAGDYGQFCPPTNEKFTPYEDYLKHLQEWCSSPFAVPVIQSVYNYVRQGTMIADLVREKVLWLDAEGQLAEKWTPELAELHGVDRPDIFKALASGQNAAFVRFAVEVPGVAEQRLWRMPEVQQSFIRFYDTKLQDTELCYVTGKLLPYADKHASRIRNSGDKTKLISANDSSGFTYRGRFLSSRDAAAVSYEVSQKAHNALKWLIDRQAFAIDGKTFVVWGTKSLDVPDPYADSSDFYDDDDDEEEDEPELAYTHAAFAERVRLGLSGYRHDTDADHSDVVIMVLDAATPGRMSINYYRDMEKEHFLQRIEAWHLSCCWLQYYRKDGKTAVFMSAPATRDIAFAAYGPRASEKVVKGLIERMLPCILDGARIPSDIVRSLIARASNPVGMEPWEWEKTLGIACAIVNRSYSNSKEGFEVAVNKDLKDRSYLFGRMLAVADVLERRALSKEERRATNAIRYMNAFAQKPGRTWMVIQSALQPYQAKLGVKASYLNGLLDEIGAQLDPEKDYSDQSLSGLYLLGFYSQRHELYQKRKQLDGEGKEEDDADLDD
ncbi:type I-C CRISPR-associated protein Cas8c/Csd1 [Paenibacillus pasadenensis]|uniref:CRISPR-associated protein, Csd1 family n=1 Tax=Paenibacillus pasadenensis TaxID=217090 RepID=A0A2N5NBN5_9BACL|nr:type I-C CRISPR-associated protein Cas8c/Csd1 [Paenibacillus pasadenensis]PLT47752.1 CRISPR-associated protein, Csd1 family [Paenibacillus pasadenensis]